MKSPGFFGGMSYLPRGWSLIWRKGIRRFVFIPVLLNLLVFILLGWLFYGKLNNWVQSISLLDRFSDWWLVAAFTGFLQWTAGILLFVVFGYLYILLANLLAAPFNSLLAERVEAHLRPGVTPPTFRLGEFVASIPVTLYSEIRKFLYLAVWMIPILLLHLVPLLNLFAPFLLFAFVAWMYSVEYLDYPMGNHGAGFVEVRNRLRQHRTTALGFGLPVAVLVMIPGLNILLMPVAVAAATALYVERFSSLPANTV